MESVYEVYKEVFIIVCIFFMFASHIEVSKAAFDIGDSTATYDSNYGILTIYDSAFAKIDYQNR